MVPERAAALISSAPSIPPEPEVPVFTLADRIFWQGIKDEVDPLRPFRPVRQCLEVVELIFGSANVRTLLPAEHTAASRVGPPAMCGRRVELADQLHQAGISILGIQETRCRGQVVELWIRQDIMGDEIPVISRVLVFFWSRATPRLGSSSTVCVVRLTARATKLKFRRGVVPPHSPSRGAMRCQSAGWIGRWPLAIRRRIGRIRLARNFLERDLCLPATFPVLHNDPAKPSGTWCSRTRWHRIDFVAVRRDWLAGADGCGASRKRVF